jgi:hypothetical protein
MKIWVVPYYRSVVENQVSHTWWQDDREGYHFTDNPHIVPSHRQNAAAQFNE